MTTVQDQLAEMFNIQNGLNTKSYDQTWLEKGKTGEFDYALAAGQELAEFFGSLPFDWWTGSREDRLNCVTELVDAWHFIMSQAIIDCNGKVDMAIINAADAFDQSDDVDVHALKTDVMKVGKKLIARMYLSYAPSDYIKEFFNLCAIYNVPFDLLYARYIAKATLNKFRVENGYKQKLYAKKWSFGDDRQPEEDNYYLSSWVHEQINAGVQPSQDAIHAWLTETYAGVKNKPVAA